jgi:hypothetical protein
MVRQPQPLRGTAESNQAGAIHFHLLTNFFPAFMYWTVMFERIGLWPVNCLAIRCHFVERGVSLRTFQSFVISTKCKGML